MRLIPYSRQSISVEEEEAVIGVLRSDFLTQGPEVELFEREFADFHGAMLPGLATCNATAALHLLCMALNLNSNSIVWTSPISFVASANCALYCGARIDFVDINQYTRNIDIDELKKKLELANLEGTLPDLLIVVHFSGLPCDLNEICELSKIYGFKIIEDASHAVAAKYHNNYLIGQYSEAVVFSFHPVKIITTAEGGMILTENSKLREQLELLRSHGITRKNVRNINNQPWLYEQNILGFNYRMNDIQATLGRVQLRKLNKFQKRREEIQVQYQSALSCLPIKLPFVPSDRVSSWHLYVIEVKSFIRDSLFLALTKKNIKVNVHYIPIHLQPYYKKKFGYKTGDFPVAENYYAGAITLPLHPSMTNHEVSYVIESFKKIYEMNQWS